MPSSPADNPSTNPWATAATQPRQAVGNLPAHLDLWQQTLGWQPDADQLSLFQQFYAQIVDGNQRFNLTRITTPEDFWEKHLWDSLSGIAPWLADPTEVEALEDGEEAATGDRDEDALRPIRMIDIGSGGGVPGIPVAIALTPIFQKLGQTVDLTLLDATRKKVQFLEETCRLLSLPATCIAERAEALGQQPAHRAQYDLALVRAVGPVSTCAEYALPLLKEGGQAVLYRGQWSTEETEALLPVIDLLGGEITDLQTQQTPLTQGARNCIFIYKDAPTPDDFPRAIGVPGKKPLT